MSNSISFEGEKSWLENSIFPGHHGLIEYYVVQSRACTEQLEDFKGGGRNNQIFLNIEVNFSNRPLTYVVKEVDSTMLTLIQ